MANNQSIGKYGEELAKTFLQERGYEIIESNWRYHHLEIDIIATFHKTLHIVEVKTRHSLQFGFPEDSISKNKMRFLKNAAEAYQFKYPYWKCLQFDVVAITLHTNQNPEYLFLEDVYF